MQTLEKQQNIFKQKYFLQQKLDTSFKVLQVRLILVLSNILCHFMPLVLSCIRDQKLSAICSSVRWLFLFLLMYLKPECA